MLFSMGCNSFEQARNTDLVQPISVTIVANTAIPDFDSASGAKVELINEYEQVAYSYPLTGHETKVSGVLPGIYSINISGETVGLMVKSLTPMVACSIILFWKMGCV